VDDVKAADRGRDLYDVEEAMQHADNAPLFGRDHQEDAGREMRNFNRIKRQRNTPSSTEMVSSNDESCPDPIRNRPGGGLGNICRAAGSNCYDGIFDLCSDEVFQSGVKLHYCKHCLMYQPLRTKHCPECERCVMTHDHHCPWIGTCVGERNRCAFYWYLHFQQIELLWTFIEYVKVLSIGYSHSEQLNLKDSPLLHVSLLFWMICIILLLLMVSCLVCYHTFLMLTNLTSWENLAWQRITYLKDIPEQMGSPFSRGGCGNLAVYCCAYHVPEWVRRCFVSKSAYEADFGVIWEKGKPHVPRLINTCCYHCCYS